MSVILTIIVFSFLSCSSYSQNKVPESDKVVLQYLTRESNIENPPVIIMLHGLSSNKEDMFSLADQIPDKYLVVSVQAPYKIGWNSYAWFHVSFSSGKPVFDEAEVMKSRDDLSLFIDQIIQKYHADAKNVTMMGFSQGAIMSLTTGLTHPEKLSRIGAFSGRIPDLAKENIGQESVLKNIKVYLAHSKNDQMIGYQKALESKQFLDSKGINTVFNTYNVGHSISNENFNAFLEWLSY